MKADPLLTQRLKRLAARRRRAQAAAAKKADQDEDGWEDDDDPPAPASEVCRRGTQCALWLGGWLWNFALLAVVAFLWLWVQSLPKKHGVKTAHIPEKSGWWMP